jgi:D-serine deaminase-like pyridoxal phosphate-dependent protein
MTILNYPLPSREALLSQFRGQPLTALPTPAVVLDRALVAKHCAAMLRVCAALGVGFRAHVKSHKTLEVAQMQVGSEAGSGPADFVVSTLVEAEALAGWLGECQAKGREGSVSCP